MIDSGEVKDQSELALKLDISKARASQVLSLLKLNAALITAVDKIGNPMPKTGDLQSLGVMPYPKKASQEPETETISNKSKI